MTHPEPHLGVTPVNPGLPFLVPPPTAQVCLPLLHTSVPFSSSFLECRPVLSNELTESYQKSGVAVGGSLFCVTRTVLDTAKALGKYLSTELKMVCEGTSLVVQWLRIRLPMQGMWVPPLVGELRSHMPWGN